MSLNDILSLNVGGTRFETTRQTLMRDSESMLARMFDPDSQIAPAQIKDGSYFIDRSPNMFAIIIDYLRSDYLKDLTDSSLKELQVEAEYYQLISLLEIIKQRLGVEEDNNSNSKDVVNVIVGGQTYKCKPDALQYCDKELIDNNGDFNARDISSWICLRQRNGCDCDDFHAPTLEDLVRRVLRRLEENRVGDVQPPLRTELIEDSFAAMIMGLFLGYSEDIPKWFY